MSSLFDLKGKTAIITGSSRGIGRAIAVRMAEHGANVVVSSRNQGACDLVTNDINASGGVAVSKTCNIGSKEELQALVDTAVSTFGGLDILVCNAAINPVVGPSSQLSDEAWDRVMNYNVRSTHWLCRMAAPHIKARGGGTMVVISSIGGLRGYSQLGVYTISKAADMQLVRNLACEYGENNIRINAIAPGLIRTDFARVYWEDPKLEKKATRTTPLRRMGEPDEIAAMAVFLASPGGSFATGQTFVIDGGETIGTRTIDGD